MEVLRASDEKLSALRQELSAASTMKQRGEEAKARLTDRPLVLARVRISTQPAVVLVDRNCLRCHVPFRVATRFLRLCEPCRTSDTAGV